MGDRAGAAGCWLLVLGAGCWCCELDVRVLEAGYWCCRWAPALVLARCYEHALDVNQERFEFARNSGVEPCLCVT